MGLNSKDSLPQEVKNLFLPFLDKVVELNQGNLVSVFIYGSATGANFIPKASDINSVMVVQNITLEVLRKNLKPIAAAKRKRIEAPLIFTEGHIKSSLDVFPIEFLDMKENYAVVYGKDVLKDIVVHDDHVRLFCEQQIKGKLIRVRQAYLEVGLKSRGVESLLRESLNSLIPVFRSLLRLKKADVPLDKEVLLNKIKELFGIETRVMVDIWREKKNNERVGGRHAVEAFDEYIKELEMLAKVVDQL